MVLDYVNFVPRYRYRELAVAGTTVMQYSPPNIRIIGQAGAIAGFRHINLNWHQ